MTCNDKSSWTLPLSEVNMPTQHDGKTIDFNNETVCKQMDTTGLWSGVKTDYNVNIPIKFSGTIPSSKLEKGCNYYHTTNPDGTTGGRFIWHTSAEPTCNLDLPNECPKVTDCSAKTNLVYDTDPDKIYNEITNGTVEPNGPVSISNIIASLFTKPVDTIVQSMSITVDDISVKTPEPSEQTEQQPNSSLENQQTIKDTSRERSWSIPLNKCKNHLTEESCARLNENGGGTWTIEKCN